MDLISVILASVAIVISLGSLLVVILNNSKKAKSDQFRIALELNYKTDEIENKLDSAIEKFDSTSRSDEDRTKFQNSLKYYYADKLNTFELFALLINKREITHEIIIRHYKKILIKETNRIFHEYPDWRSDTKIFEELKKLLKRFEEGEFSDCTLFDSKYITLIHYYEIFVSCLIIFVITNPKKQNF